MSKTMEKIQVLKPYYRVDECLNEIKECLDIGWTGMGFKTESFEEEWKSYTGLSNAHFINSATSGLHLALHILKKEHAWEDGDEIITTSLTFVSTNHAIKYENLKPRFADVDDSLNLNPESIAKNINDKTRAIIFVGIGGNSRNLAETIKIAKKHGLKVILDAAHMAGSKIDNSHVGQGVDVSVFSFQTVKNLPTADGGMICFQSNELDKKCRKISWLGIDKDTFNRSHEGTYRWDYNVDEVGFKYHGNSIMAALGKVALKYLDEDNAYRVQLCNEYVKALDGRVKYIKHDNGSSRHLFQIVVENREHVINELYKRNIFVGVHYKNNTRYKPYEGTQLDNSEYYSERVLSLPLHLNLNKEHIKYIGSNLIDIIKQSGT